jgi:hypothetical protein
MLSQSGEAEADPARPHRFHESDRGEFAAIEAQAGKRGVNLSEWAREVLLDRLKPDEVPGNKILLGEVMALRTIVINLAGRASRP